VRIRSEHNDGKGGGNYEQKLSAARRSELTIWDI
jgi:hypothetical protein